MTLVVVAACSLHGFALLAVVRASGLRLQRLLRNSDDDDDDDDDGNRTLRAHDTS